MTSKPILIIVTLWKIIIIIIITKVIHVSAKSSTFHCKRFQRILTIYTLIEPTIGSTLINTKLKPQNGPYEVAIFLPFLFFFFFSFSLSLSLQQAPLILYTCTSKLVNAFHHAWDLGILIWPKIRIKYPHIYAYTRLSMLPQSKTQGQCFGTKAKYMDSHMHSHALRVWT